MLGKQQEYKKDIQLQYHIQRFSMQFLHEGSHFSAFVVYVKHNTCILSDNKTQVTKKNKQLYTSKVFSHNREKKKENMQNITCLNAHFIVTELPLTSRLVCQTGIFILRNVGPQKKKKKERKKRNTGLYHLKNRYIFKTRINFSCSTG